MVYWLSVNILDHEHRQNMNNLFGLPPPAVINQEVGTEAVKRQWPLGDNL